jgi:hypothetical protein
MITKEYFSHDYNTRNKKKLAAIIHDYKMTGYGLFWVIAEMLHEDGENWMDLDQLTFISIAKESGCEVEFVKEFVGKCIDVYKVFIQKDGKFTTERVLRNIDKRLDIRAKRSKAGKASANVRQVSTHDEHMLNNRSTKSNKGKESKVKEKKVSKNRAIALVGSAEPTHGGDTDLKKKYSELTNALAGKELKEVWTSLTCFIKDNSPEFIEPFVDIWNIFATTYKLSRLKDINETRRRKFSSRIREPSFDFLKILEGIKTSPHLKGENDRGWKADFNWILENDTNYLKILEGNYN